MAFEPITTQEAFDAAIQERLTRERNAHAAREQELTARIDGLTKQLEGLPALQQQVTELTEKNRSLELDGLRTKVALDKGLPMELRSRLTGDTEEDLIKDADVLTSIFKKTIPGFTPEKSLPPENDEKAAYKKMLSELI